MILSKVPFIKNSNLLLNYSFNQRYLCSILLPTQQQQQQQSLQFMIEKENKKKQFMKGNDKVIQMQTKRNIHSFGRQSASQTGESFYRTPKNLEYDPSLKAGIFLQMFFDYCTPSLWSHKYQTAVDLIRDAMKHFDAEIKCNGSNFVDMQMREATKLKQK